MAANSPVKHMFPHPPLDRVISISPASIMIFTCLNLKAMHGTMECDGWPELTRDGSASLKAHGLHGEGWGSQMKIKLLWRRKDRAETLSRQPAKSTLVAIFIIDFLALSPWCLSIL